MITCINKKKAAAIGGIVTAAIVMIALAVGSLSHEVESTYRETAVQLGNLVVGVTEDGSVDIGTVEQVFELDMSALQRTETGNGTGSATGSGTGNGTGSGTGNGTGSSTGNSTGNSTGGLGTLGSGGMQGIENSSGSAEGAGVPGGNAGQSGSGGGMNMFDQLLGLAGGGSFGAEDSAYSLTVEQVLVTQGQQVEEGDVLYLLEEESVSKLKEELSANVEKAKADLDAVYGDQKLSQNTAEYHYKSSNAYGVYANAEYENTINQLQLETDTCERNLEKARMVAQEYEEQLSQTQEDYQEALNLLEQCEWGCDNADKWNNPYEYTANCQLAQKAQSNLDTLEQKKEQLEQKKEQARINVETSAKELSAAERNLAQGKLSAQKDLSLNKLAYSTAQETYNVALEYLEIEVKAQEEIYEGAQEKWEEFSSHIRDNAVCAGYSGVITNVELEKGDSIYTGDILAAMYDMDQVTMKVTISEEDRGDISEETQANISFTAYPDQTFQASVSEISEAIADSKGNVVYEVTVTLKGDVSGLFQGMTGSVTFITRETKEVLYVSNRAILREGGKSYVKVKDADGNIEKQEVKTGFSDGINVEIKEGLSQGDTVLIESKVKEG